MYFQLGVNETVDAVQRVSKTINEESAMVVAMAILFVGFIIMFINMIKNNSKFDELHKEYIKSMSDIRDSMTNQTNLLKTHSQLLQTLVDGVSDELSNRQIDDVCDMFFSKSMLKVLESLDQIIRDNHISDTKATKLKVELVVSNIAAYDKEMAMNFKFKGTPLSASLNNDWKTRLIDSILKEIYAPGGYNPRVARTNLDILYKNIRSEFIDNIYKNAARC